MISNAHTEQIDGVNIRTSTGRMNAYTDLNELFRADAIFEKYSWANAKENIQTRHNSRNAYSNTEPNSMHHNHNNQRGLVARSCALLGDTFDACQCN